MPKSTGCNLFKCAPKSQLGLIIKSFFTVATVSWVLSGTVHGEERRQLLPDLISLADEARGYLYGWTIEETPTRTLLRLSTAMANIGEGPMELRGSTTHPDGTQDVLQRIYYSDGTFEDRLAGIFEYHPTHGHIHFAGFADYNLREVLPNNGVGNIVATGDKVSFCLVDFDGYDKSLIGSSERGVYRSCAGFQGISVGWADVYEEGLPDQWIDVTNVPYGMYWLEVATDPEDQLEEIDETNNVARILIEYSAPTSISKDALEPNDNAEDSYYFGNGSTVSRNNLTIHAPGNDDFYSWVSPSTGVLTLDVGFQNNQGDLNVFLYRLPFEEVGESTGNGNLERIIVPTTPGQVHYFRVIGAGDDISPAYSVSLAFRPEEIVYPRDVWESNNSLTTARSVPSSDFIQPGLSLHSVVDVDYYRWTSLGTGTLTVTAEFMHSLGDVDLFLFTNDGRLLMSSTGALDHEELSFSVKDQTTYIIKVSGHHYDTQPSYTLTLDGPELAGDIDRDGDVDLDDFAELVATFRQSGPGLRADVNDDNVVDLRDFVIVKRDYQ